MPVTTIILSNLSSSLHQSRINSHKVQNASNNKCHLDEISGEMFPK